MERFPTIHRFKNKFPILEPFNGAASTSVKQTALVLNAENIRSVVDVTLGQGLYVMVKIALVFIDKILHKISPPQP